MPPNCSFEREDAEDMWTLNRMFDYVHLRMMFTCFDNPRKVMRRAFAHMNPGAWIEYQDINLDFSSWFRSHEGTAIQRWSQLMVAGAKAKGRNMLHVRDYDIQLRKVGFVDIGTHYTPLPCSPWAEGGAFFDAGLFVSQVLSQRGLEALSLELLSAAGLKPIEIRNLISEVLADIQNSRIHGFWPFHVVWGRKPPV
jgi:hypothetical protein